MATPNLNITEVAASQNQKHVTINNALVALDNAMNSSTAKTIAGNTTLTAAELRGAQMFVLSGTPGAPFTLNVPASIKKVFGVINGTDGVATVQVDGGGGASVEVAVSASTLCWTDGTDVYALGGGSGGGGSVGIEDEGSTILAAMTSINFAGTGVSVADDGDDTATVTIPGLSDTPQRTGVFRGAAVQHAGAAQSITGGVNTQITFDTETFDTTGFANLGSNNKRLVVPTGYGITKVRIHVCLDTSTPNSGAAQMWVQKNSGDSPSFPGIGGSSQTAFSGSELLSYTSPPISVVDGDYFDVWVNFASAGSIDGTAGTYFAIEVVEDQSNQNVAYAQNWSVPWRGATAYLTADDTTVNLSSFVTYNWDATVNDTDGFWDGGQPSRLTVPAGVTKVRLSGMVKVDSTDGLANLYQVIRKNGTSVYIGSGVTAGEDGFPNQQGSVTTGVIEVAEGDYFDFGVLFDGETSETVSSGESYFQIEVVETSDSAKRLFDVSTFIPGTPSAGTIVLQHVLARSATLRATAPGAQAFAGTAATGSTVFDITKNGANVGTVTFAASGTVGTFAVASDVTFVAGDRIGIVSENPADATLADISITIPIDVG